MCVLSKLYFTEFGKVHANDTCGFLGFVTEVNRSKADRNREHFA